LLRPIKGQEHLYSIAPANDAARLYTVWPASEAPTCSRARKIVGRDEAHELADLLGRDHYELVAGERRWRAAKLAELAVIPAIIRDMSDRDALECAIIENEQRQDVSPAEKADGYAMLVEQHGVRVEDLAARVGKSPSTIRGLLRLRLLPPAAREALESGRLPASIAELVASRPSAAMREKVAAFALAEREAWQPDGRVKELPSYRNVKAYVSQECMVELKGAPFERKDLELVPAAGACTTCPKCSGNNREEMPDGRADLCTDPPCYRQKVAAWQARLLADAEVKGQKVLTEKEAAKVFPYSSGMAYDSPYFDLAEQCYEDKAKKKPRSYKQLLSAHITDADVVLAFDRRDGLHRLVAKDVAVPLLKQHHGISKGSQHTNGSLREDKAEKAKRMAAAKLERETHRAILAAAHTAAINLFLDGLKADTLEHKDALRVLAVVCINAIDHTYNLDDLVGRRGLKAKSMAEKKEALHGVIDEAGAAGLLALLVEVAAARYVLSNSKDGYGGHLAELLGIDEAQIKAKVKQKLKTARKPVCASGAIYIQPHEEDE
jgi:ParB/RepB/Spo0J family partition protein